MINFGGLKGRDLNDQMTQATRTRPGFILTAGLASLAGAVGIGFGGSWLSMLGAGALGATGLTSLWKLAQEYKRFINPAQQFSGRKFEEKTVRSLRGQEVATLRYEDNIPIVTFSTTSSPRERGLAMAELTHQATFELLDRFVAWVPTFVRLLQKRFFIDPMQEVANNIEENQFTFPLDYLEYVSGFVAGMNAQIQKENKSLFFPRKLLTVKDFHQFICMYDTFKLMACTSGVRVNRHQNGFKLLRNLEWPSAGVLGSLTLATITPVNQTNRNPVKKVFSFGFTPDVGGFSLANDQGLTLTINEAGTTSTKRNHQRGVPEFLLSRQIAENCATLEEVKAYLVANPPATTHSLTIMDKTGGAVFQMLPPHSGEIYSLRTLGREGYVHIANHFLDREGAIVEGSIAWPNSPQRHACMGDNLSKTPYVKSSEVVKAAADVDDVHALTFSLQAHEFKFKARWGNTKDTMEGHSGKLDLGRLFARP